MVPAKVGKELRQRRMVMKLSQAELAKRVGVSRAYIGNVENGVEWEPAAETLVAWAMELGLDPVTLLRSLGRASASETAQAVLVAGELSPAVLDAIRREVALGVQEGVEAALREVRDDQEPKPSVGPPTGPRPRPQT